MAKSEYAKLRKAAVQSANRLAKAGYKAPDFPKMSELKTQKQLQAAIEKARSFMQSPEHTVPGAKLFADSSKLVKRVTRSAKGKPASRSKQARRAAQQRYRSGISYKRNYANKMAKQWGLDQYERNILLAARKAGFTGKQIGKKNIKQFAEYVQFRLSIKHERSYYMDEYADTFNKLVQKSGHADVLTDFKLFQAEQEALAARAAFDSNQYSSNVTQNLWNRFVKQTLGQ